MAVVKVIDLVGDSQESFEDAVKEAVRQAAKTVRHISGVEVVNFTGNVNEQGEIVEFKANVKVAFRVEEE